MTRRATIIRSGNRWHTEGVERGGSYAGAEMDALVDDFAGRRPRGLAEAYALWSRAFVSVARHVLVDDARAEDCVHDALLRVWRAPNRFQGNRSMLKAYLIACVRNESIAMLRSDRRRDDREVRAARLGPLESEDFATVDPIEAMHVRAALARLPGDQRAALERAYYGNCTHVQIAEDLGVPLGTIKSRIALAMRKLRAELAAAGENPA